MLSDYVIVFYQWRNNLNAQPCLIDNFGQCGSELLSGIAVFILESYYDTLSFGLGLLAFSISYDYRHSNSNQYHISVFKIGVVGSFSPF